MDLPLAPSSGGPRLPSSSHRLPTVSASQALQELQARGPRSISTGLAHLDTLLSTSDGQQHGGFARRKITEVWGPPGSGKSSIAMQAAAHALHSGDSVVWVDASAPLAIPRLRDILTAVAPDGSAESDSSLSKFHAYFTPTVAHLLALTLHAPTCFPPPDTALMVIDGLHAVFETAYPRYRAHTFSGNRSEAARWTAGRRYGILGSLIAALKKLAALHDVAVLVTTGCATRVRSGSGLGAMLAPGLGGAEWEAGITNRLVMFRDFRQAGQSQQQQQQQRRESARYVGLQKVNGVAFSEEGETGQLVPFIIDQDGLKDLTEDANADAPVVALAVSSPTKGRKRAYGEIADPEGEAGRDEYGWLNEDGVAAEGLVDEEAMVEIDVDAVRPNVDD